MRIRDTSCLPSGQRTIARPCSEPPRTAALSAVWVLALVSALSSACTLMKPSHEELSGGDPVTQDFDAASGDASVVDSDVSDAAVADSLEASADTGVDGDSATACEAGGKSCGGECVATDDPGLGCGSPVCDPCVLANAEPACAAGVCVVDQCTGDGKDCDLVGANGCEVDSANDPLHCGGCDLPCPVAANTVGVCSNGICGSPVCLPGWDRCLADAGTDGCMSHVAEDPLNCGACGVACPSGPNATATCFGSSCDLLCDSSFDDCNGDPADGCETDVFTDTTHCGACHQGCSFAHAQAYCDSGSCGIAACAPLWGNCNLVESDGCELDLSANKQNCGTCGSSCPGSQKCVDGSCV